jgi:acetyl esterase/lipase
MASHLFDWVARRRVAREEAEAVRLFAASQSPPACVDPLTQARQPRHRNCGSEGDEQCAAARDTPYASLPYTPSCCGTVGEPGAPAYPITVLRNIPYFDGANSTTRHQLDIYYSPQAILHHRSSKVDAGHLGVPVTIHVHGGGWQRGDRANEWRGGPNAGRSIARHGMVGVCPSYRLAAPGWFGIVIWISILSFLAVCIASSFSEWVWAALFTRWLQLVTIVLLVGVVNRRFDRSKVQHPEPALDVCRAVKWVREHLVEHVPQADVDRIFLSGHSAGAHLVSLVSTDSRYYRMVGLTDTSFIRGVCSVSGIYSLYGPVHLNPEALRNRLFRLTYGAAAFGPAKAGLIDASPITHVSKAAPPFLLMSAASDMGLEIDAQRFADRLAQFDIPYEYHTIQNTSHASIASHFEKHQAHQHLFRFIDRYASYVPPDRCCQEPNESRLQLANEPYVHVARPPAAPKSAGGKKSSKKKKAMSRTATQSH